MSAFVLAGGASSRMGTDKALLPLQGLTLLERSLHLLEAAGFQPRIVASRPDLEHFAPLVQDLRRGCGPLSGIEAALLACESDLAVFIPVDTPLLTPFLIGLLAARAVVTGALATIPRALGIAQPLCAVYHRALLPGISASLEAADFKVMRVIQNATATLGGSVDLFNVETVLTAQCKFMAIAGTVNGAFANCNTPEDFSRIQHHLA